jgi:phage terminase large subunit-like protein
MNRFGDLLGQIIKNSGKSLRENAIEWKWVHSHLSRIVTGKMPPKTLTVAKACRLVDAGTAMKLVEAYLADERDRIESLVLHQGM